jgi:hypothetical protein
LLERPVVEVVHHSAQKGVSLSWQHAPNHAQEETMK